MATKKITAREKALQEWIELFTSSRFNEAEKKTLIANSVFTERLLSELWDYLLTDMNETIPQDEDEQNEALTIWTFRLQHLKEAIEVIESAQRREFFGHHGKQVQMTTPKT